jgi:hypothetical protein
MPNEPLAGALHLLLTEDGPRSPVLGQGVGAPQLGAGEVGQGSPAPSFLWDDGADPNDLGLQRWGLVVPEGPVGAAALAALAPLIALRTADQGGVRPLIYEVPWIEAASDAVRWRRRTFETSAIVADLPRYLLVVGDLHEVSHAVQGALAVDAFVGRLPWSDPARLRAYAERVVAHEAGLPGTPPSLHLHAVEDGTTATRHAEEVLVTPLAARLRADLDLDASTVHHLQPGGPLSRQGLRDWLANGARSVALTVAHGLGPPRAGWANAEVQRERQGALCLAPEHEPLGGAEVADGPVWPGGVWFHLACYSAGVPTHSAYAHWLRRAAEQDWRLAATAERTLQGLALPGTRPFVSVLPREVLANPQGPVAFVGHVDLAWSYAYTSEDGGRLNHLEPHAEFFRSLARGDRIGVAARRARRTLPYVEAQLGAWVDEQARGEAGPSAQELGMLWMLRNDLGAYVTLGDPAVRVRSRAPVVKEEPRPARVTAPATLETCLGRVLAGELSEEEAAALLRMPGGRFSQIFAAWRRAGRKVLVEQGLL